jgi:hypothetical protein
MIYSLAIFIFFSAPNNASQEFTFITEPAYTQEKGEWQINLVLEQPKYLQGFSADLEANLSLEYGFSDALQGEFSSSRSNKLTANSITDMETEYELSLSYMLVEQQNFIPQLTIEAGVMAEDSEYGYETGILYSYQVTEQHFIHGNFLYETLDNKDEIVANLAYAFVVNDYWTLLAEMERNKEKDNYNLSSYVNMLSGGVVYETSNDIELGLAYLLFNGDTVQDYSWQFKVAYEF